MPHSVVGFDGTVGACLHRPGRGKDEKLRTHASGESVPYVAEARVSQKVIDSDGVNPRVDEIHCILPRSCVPAEFSGHGQEGKSAYEFAYFLVHAEIGMTLREMVCWTGLRWNVEDDNRAA